MELDPDVCYRALQSRDRRFDGRFFTGVRTTGIYCRPVCPARTPKAENITFFPTAAAAEAAGLRPCMRCRPEASPGTPAWLGSSDTTSRAIRMIAAGALDEGSVDDLAARLGVGSRQLRRLFMEHLGASPISIARSRRTHFARSLLDQTALSVSEIAFASGFGSIRQFNDAMRATFGGSPTALRRRRSRVYRDQGTLSVKLSYRTPIDFDSLLAFLGGRAIRGVEVVSDGRYARLVEVDGSAGSIELIPHPDAEHVELRMRLPRYDSLIDIVERARRIFDLSADPESIVARLGDDPVLGSMVTRRPGMRVPGAWDAFEVAVRAILGQQISVQAANALAARLVETFGKPVEGVDIPGLTHLFPDPGTIAGADLRSVGMNRTQSSAIGALSEGLVSGTFELHSAHGLDDAVERLCALPGVGPWTAHYICMRALGEPDAFPGSDLGLRKAAGGTEPVPAPDLEEAAQAWRPWRSYAAMYLWTELASHEAARKGASK